MKTKRSQVWEAFFLIVCFCVWSGMMRTSVFNIFSNPAHLARPTEQQLAWQDFELGMFVHFGMNTFTNKEWGEGNEDPKVFNPSSLDAAQWARTAKLAGFRYLILTA